VPLIRVTPVAPTYTSQVAYLMADISDVQTSEIKDISDSLEALSCRCTEVLKDFHPANPRSTHSHTHTLLT
jgi:hypothetical protein